MRVLEKHVIKIYQGSEMHCLIIVLSCISFILFAVLAVMSVKKPTLIKQNVSKTINRVFYIISSLSATMMLFNPSIWYQYVFMNTKGVFYQNNFNIVILVSNLIIMVILPYSYISKHHVFKWFSFVAFPIIVIQVINPSLFLFYKEIENPVVNKVAIAGYVAFLIINTGLSTYNIVNIIFGKRKLYNSKELIVAILLLIPILIPYILFSRSDIFVKRYFNNEVDLIGLMRVVSITSFTLSHLIFVLFNVFLFFIYGYILQKVIKKDYLHDVLIILVTGLIFTVLCRRATYLFDNNIGFHILPDSPCAIGSFIAYFGLVFRKKTLANYSVFVTFAFTTLNNLIMFQGNFGNFFNHLVMDSVFYHLYLSIIVFNISKLYFFSPNKKSIFKCCSIFSVIYFFYVFLGNVQSRIEFLTDLDMASDMYVGFFYNHPPYEFLNKLVYSFAIVNKGFEILPINWIITLGVAYAMICVSYFVYQLFINLKNKKQFVISVSKSEI